MKIVQIKGANGSGKSTIPLQLLAQSNDVVHVLEGHIVTILDDLKWVLIGPYYRDASSPTSNGCDNLGKIQKIKDAIVWAMNTRPSYNILFEGMMVSTIKSTFYDFLLGLEATDGIEPIFVILVTDVEHCLARIDARGTAKGPTPQSKIDNIHHKCDMVVRHAKTYDQSYVRWMHVDDIPKELMSDVFLGAIGEEIMDDDTSIHPGMYTYMDIVKMRAPDIITVLEADGVEAEILHNMDQLHLRRELMLRALEPLVIDRSEVLPAKGDAPVLFAPWCVRNTDYPPIYEREIGYRSSTKHYMSLLVLLHQIPREDVPLLTEWEQVALCDDCKGAGGACPGLSPRFDSLRPSTNWLNVVTITMDYCWAMEYGSARSWYMLSGYTDMVTVSYINRITDALGEATEEYMLGAHNCPGKCKDCAALKTGKCGRKKRRFSMESVGIDCDELHRMMFNEWMPWAYKGHEVAPTYMTRYASWMSEDQMPIEEAAMIMDDAIEADKTYSAFDEGYVNEIVNRYGGILLPYDIPAGPHKGCRMMVYNFPQLKENRNA